MANIPPPPHESEGFLPEADASCSEAVVAATQRGKSSICGEVRRLAEQDAFDLSDSVFKAEYKSKRNDCLVA